ncbi:MAG TPA: hypothetical protein VGG71_07870, partial [Chitinophagaceae bacterium]
NIPRQFVLAFFNEDYDAASYYGNPQKKIHFYVDATTGQPFTHKDVENYFKRINVPPVPSYFKPLNAVKVIQVLLEELARCFDEPHKMYKRNELLQLANLLS